MLISKIVSGGQTGVDRGALEAARRGLGKWVKGDEAQSFYKFVLDNYVQGGVDVFTREDALSQLIITKYRTINDAKSRLGELKSIQHGFATLQREVYAA